MRLEGKPPHVHPKVFFYSVLSLGLGSVGDAEEVRHSLALQSPQSHWSSGTKTQNKGNDTSLCVVSTCTAAARVTPSAWAILPRM